MNFLAHIYLSNEENGIKIGNFIGDFVKGRDAESYPDKIKRGIYLHRLIDEFTDSHPVVLESKKRLRPIYHHYSPVIVDVYYDHFLARNFRDYCPVDLDDYAKNFYKTTNDYIDLIPPNAKTLLFHMKEGNWLFHYSTLDGIGQALSGMSRRTRFDSKMEFAVRDLEKNYTEFEDEFKNFFPDLIKLSTGYIHDHA